MAAPIDTFTIANSFVFNLYVLQLFFVDFYCCDTHTQSFYSFSVRDAEEDTVLLEQYHGKVTLVVNVASECGFTDGHYKGLIRLKNVFLTSDKFEILAFPCNQFGQQEPKSNAAIQKFVKDMYLVNFPVFSKVDVLGDHVSMAWQYLISSFGSPPNWNFWKYLVDENGHVVNAWGPWTAVEDIFHEVKQAVDRISYEKPSYLKQHADEL